MHRTSLLSRILLDQFALGSLGSCCSCGCTFTICVQSCGGLGISGASVAIKSGGATIAGGTTDGSGCVTLDIGSAGTYELIVSDTGYSTYDGNVAMTCGGSKTVKLYSAGSYAVCFTVYGCCGNVLAGATVSIGGATLTADGSGKACWANTDPGTFPYTVSAGRFNDATGSVTLSGCAAEVDITVHLTPASGYHCGIFQADGGINAAYPLPGTLNLTDSAYGSCTLTWTGGVWTGTLTGVGYPGCTNGGRTCPPASFSINYTLDGCLSPGSGGITIAFSACDYDTCFGGGSSVDSTWCPCDTSDSCTGKPNGTKLLDHSGIVGPVAPWANALNLASSVTLSIPSANPADLEWTITYGGPAPVPCGAGTSPLYGSGATTITVTE